MIVGTLRLELAVYEARSLKDKRRVVSSIKERLRNRYQVAVAEVDALDVHRRAVLGVAAVGNERSVVESRLDKVLDFVSRNPHAALIGQQREYFSAN